MAYTFRYRLPGTVDIVNGAANHCLKQPQNNGFLIAPFTPHAPMIFIPDEIECDPGMMRKAFEENGSGTMFPFPESSTLPDGHRAEIHEIIRMENSGILTKAVAARCLVSDKIMDINKTFDKLCRIYPDAFVFLFSTPESGTWIGATPEVLLTCCNGRLHTMALAGTRRAGTPGTWDEKNIREQSVVTDYIKRCFRHNNLSVSTDGPYTVDAGPVEHLRTDIRCDAADSTDILRLLDSLAPTPALCGMPRKSAAEVITRTENFQRGFFGGYCGPWKDNDNFSMYVILRCARVAPEATCLFAGSGIMPESNPDDEWKETEAKMDTIRNMI